MINLEIALRVNRMTQKEFAALAGIHAPTLSLIMNKQAKATDEQKKRIAAIFPKADKEKLFEDIDLGQATAKYQSIFTPRKLSPAIQAQLDREITVLKKELAEYKGKEPERLKAKAEKTALKFFGKQ